MHVRPKLGGPADICHESTAGVDSVNWTHRTPESSGSPADMTMGPDTKNDVSSSKTAVGSGRWLRWGSRQYQLDPTLSTALKARGFEA